MFKTAWINNSFIMWWPKRNDTKHKHNFSLWKATKQWRNKIYAHVLYVYSKFEKCHGKFIMFIYEMIVFCGKYQKSYFMFYG